jgi:molybdopterin synthase catalytic subunit
MKELNFISGNIKPEVLASEILTLEEQKQIGAHSWFLGQVRNDLIDKKEVIGIEYSAYQEMAIHAFQQICQILEDKFDLSYFKVYHSLGMVEVGQLCLLVVSAGKHRRTVLDATDFAVELIKKDLPVWGKEIFKDESHQWKVNS